MLVLGFPMTCLVLFDLLFMKAWIFSECLYLPNLGSFSNQVYSKTKLFSFVGYCVSSTCSIIIIVMDLICIVLYGDYYRITIYQIITINRADITGTILLKNVLKHKPRFFMPNLVHQITVSKCTLLRTLEIFLQKGMNI